MTDPLIIEARGLHTYYGASHILQGVDFTVGAGEAVGLMGRNGMGKSTLIRTLLGHVPARRGEVKINGTPMTGAAPHQIARQGIAYVPEGRGIFPNLSVRENLVMAARPGRNGETPWTYERVLETFPRLGDRLTHGGQQLSGGEQQMLVHRPRPDDQSKSLDPRRSHRRLGAADRARNLAHHQNDSRNRHRGDHRRQKLRRGLGAHR